MKRIQIGALFAVVTVATACSIPNPLKGGDGNLKTASELWSDVPKMDGLTQSQLEMPVYIKLLMRTSLNQVLGRGGKDTGDWIVFETTKTPDDIKNFYSSERMAGTGWDKSDKSTCLSGNDQGITQVRLFCVFSKHVGDKDIGLMIVTAQDEGTKQANVFFVRVEGTSDTAATKSTNDKPSKPAPDTTSLKMVNGPVPYGIDQRPMPAGLNLDQLVPQQVGPYIRESLRLASRQDVQPTAIEIDRDSVYAQYRSGSASVLVELGVSSKAAWAQDSLKTAADEATPESPTDERFGALGREPSYVKVISGNDAFFAWTRGGYFFSASSKNGEAALTAFMQAFPY
jgi:hypothetical protein